MKFITALFAASFANLAFTQASPSFTNEVSQIVNKIKEEISQKSPSEILKEIQDKITEKLPEAVEDIKPIDVVEVPDIKNKVTKEIEEKKIEIDGKFRELKDKKKELRKEWRHAQKQLRQHENRFDEKTKEEWRQRHKQMKENHEQWEEMRKKHMERRREKQSEEEIDSESEVSKKDEPRPEMTPEMIERWKKIQERRKQMIQRGQKQGWDKINHEDMKKLYREGRMKRNMNHRQHRSIPTENANQQFDTARNSEHPRPMNHIKKVQPEILQIGAPQN